jgi:allantoate deiminase
MSGPARFSSRALFRCDDLAGLSEEPHRLTRTFLSAPMRAVQMRVGAWMRAAGLEVRLDAAGNVIGRREAAAGTRRARTFVLGSHLDTVPGAGRYDGILGVMLAIAAAEALGGAPLPFALDVVGFSEEEGVRFGVPFLGSRAVTGRYDAELLARRDTGGVSVAEAIRAFGNDPDDLPGAAYRPQALLGYLEPHIEQGPVLESLGLPVGVVEAITSAARLRLTFTGRAGHAGTAPMATRRDALAGAAAFVLAVERRARRVPGLVATVGQLEVQPGASNVISGEVRLSLDVRHPEEAVRDEAIGALLEEAAGLAAGRGLALTHEWQSRQAAVACDPRLMGLLEEAVREAGHPVHRLVSGAGHDAMIMSELAPVAMLFVRSVGGVSHHPDEAVLAEDVAAAHEAVVAFLRRLGAAVGAGGDGRAGV